MQRHVNRDPAVSGSVLLGPLAGVLRCAAGLCLKWAVAATGPLAWLLGPGL